MAFGRRKSMVTARLGLEPPWRACLEEAWAAYRAGTIPMGAVITDERGVVVARGRDRSYDRAGPSSRLAGTPVAHAAVDALAALASDQRYDDFTLWTSIEPCLLCHGAAVTATVGTIRYAAADPYAGAAGAVLRNPHTERRPVVLEGPLPGVAGLLAAVVHLEPYLRANPTGAVAEAYRRLAPGVVAATERVLADDVLGDAAARRASFAHVAADLVPVLEEE